MKIKYYGSAAAEGVPGMFCNCEVCEKSKKLAGKNIRTRSQSLIDDSLLIDFPPDTYLHSVVYGLDLTKIKHLVFTHSHNDHICKDELRLLSKSYSKLEDSSPLNIYATENIIDKIKDAVAEKKCVENGNMILHTITPFTQFSAGEFKIVPLAANHPTCPHSCILDIERNGKRILYAHDTAYFTQETLEYFERSHPIYSIVSLDCTSMITSNMKAHMGIEVCARVKEEFLAKGLANTNTKFVLNHFSHNGMLCHDDFLPIANKQGFEVSYDTFEIESI